MSAFPASPSVFSEIRPPSMLPYPFSATACVAVCCNKELILPESLFPPIAAHSGPRIIADKRFMSTVMLSGVSIPVISAPRLRLTACVAGSCMARRSIVTASLQPSASRRSASRVGKSFSAGMKGARSGRKIEQSSPEMILVL